jgi:hypothetical protein
LGTYRYTCCVSVIDTHPSWVDRMLARLNTISLKQQR